MKIKDRTAKVQAARKYHKVFGMWNNVSILAPYSDFIRIPSETPWVTNSSIFQYHNFPN